MTLKITIDTFRLIQIIIIKVINDNNTQRIDVL